VLLQLENKMANPMPWLSSVPQGVLARHWFAWPPLVESSSIERRKTNG
jgi:hypothetical protein